ncbi:F-box protein [Aspergillus mulundensis]|uniref:F-box domain-containing protein n=1 Tax=Aspergillus mulundensis TaxID=1810919 RepID=A0A3D8SJY8_9EURO|nr:hypothetical protein DSM5745_03214 [Aspergillus mulundensis]RDW86572.1 hypothetical protein DSM5745_03214 [Aspergillus mulundensis]
MNSTRQEIAKPVVKDELQQSVEDKQRNGFIEDCRLPCVPNTLSFCFNLSTGSSYSLLTSISFTIAHQPSTTEDGMSTRYQLRKRKQALPIEDTSRKKPEAKKAASEPASRDPVQRLNEDTLNMIFDLIPSEDLFRLERVSHQWQAAIKTWIETFGFRTRFPHTWSPGLNLSSQLSYDHFKQRARRAYLMQCGRPTKVTELWNVQHFASSGDYVVWSTKTYSDVGGFVRHNIHWQCFAPERQELRNRPQVIPASYFYSTARVDSLQINEDGVFLTHLNGPLGLKCVVYSPVEKKTLWSGSDLLFQIYGCEERQRLPRFIGKSSIYSVARIRGEYTVSAYDFRTGELLYESPNYATQESMGLFCKKDVVENSIHICPTSGETELISSVHCKPDLDGAGKKTWVLILDGRTGTQLYCAVYHNLRSYSLSIDAVSKSIVLTLRFSPSLLHYDESKSERFAIMQKFSYESGQTTPIMPRSADVVLMSHVNGDGKLAPTERLMFDPFSLAGLRWYGTRMYQTTGFQGHAIIPTTERDCLSIAEKLLQECYKNEPPVLGQCFVPTKGYCVTLPKQPEMRRYERTTAGLPQHYISDEDAITLNTTGPVALESEDHTYVFEF